MKKLFAILLCFSMLLLSGCQLQSLFQLETIEPPTGDYYGWNSFAWNCKMGTAGEFTFNRVKDDGASEDVMIRFDGQSYSITDSAGTRNYNYLISSMHTEKTDSGYLYGDYFFLTDDANMTFEKYQKAMSSPLQDHMQLLLPTELVIGKTAVADAVECFGQSPKAFADVLSSMIPVGGIEFEENSFFETVIAGSGIMRNKLCRYNYNGDRLCSVEIPLPLLIAVAELEDGGFLASLKDYANNSANCLVRYNAEGKIVWQYDFPANRDVYLRYIFQIDNAIFCLGELNTDNTAMADDLYFAKFSMDGTLLKEKIAGGSDFEQLNHVTVSKNGFTVYAATQSKDGDFPFSEDGFAADFQVQLSKDLELSKAETGPETEYISRHYGYYNGAPVYPGDKILAAKAKDKLPRSFSTVAIFARDDGYVILRCCELERYLFSSPQMSYLPSYRQLIATYYDASGTPVWQTVSEPYVE